MALLDVTELLSDPDFIDSFLVRRNVEMVDSHGRAQMVLQEISAYGSVQASSGQSLRQLADMGRTEDSIDVYTTFPLNTITAVTAADIVVWNGQEYTVTLVRPWQNFGPGFSVATCTLKPFVAAST